jgi:DNA-binding transcriptional MocR family regulator
MRLQYRAQRDTLAAELTRAAGDRLVIDVPDQGMHQCISWHICAIVRRHRTWP